jgi:hypothetical protein
MTPRFVIVDPNTRHYLARVEYPAIWTPFRSNAAEFERAEYERMLPTWPYLAGCDVEPAEDLVCPDGPACADPNCIAERRRRGLPTAHTRMVLRSLTESDDDGRGLFWSNEDGWTVQAGATVFSELEAGSFAHRPAGSIWEALS